MKSKENYMKTRMMLAAGLIIAALAAAPVAQAETIIYADDFSGAADAFLHGTAPDTRPGSETWVARTSGDGGRFYNADGTALGFNSVWDSNALLPFTPQQGYKYALNARILGVYQASGTTGGRLQFGFATDLGNIERHFTQHSVSSIYMGIGGTVNEVSVGNGTSVTHTIWTAGPTATGDFDLRIILDTTGGTGNWSVSWWAKRPNEGSYTEVLGQTSVPDLGLTRVGFGGQTARVGGNIESFQLSIIPASGTATSTTLASSANPSDLGQGVTFTATIDPGAGSTNPTGSVQFKINGSDFGDPVAVTNGVGLTGTATSTSTSALSAGPHTVVAVYSGDGSYLTSTSSELTQTVRTAYETWAAGSFENAFTDTDPAHDPDGDGLTNFDEFAFGLDPTSGASVNPIVDTSELQAGYFKYTRLQNSGLVYTVWTSPDLDNWTDVSGSIAEEALPDAGIETVTVDFGAAPEGERFFVRVKAE